MNSLCMFYVYMFRLIYINIYRQFSRTLIILTDLSEPTILVFKIWNLSKDSPKIGNAKL